MADPIKTAKHIFDQFLSKADPESMPNYDPQAKDAKAQKAGRKGGKRGGSARASKLPSKKRREIARLAAVHRWKSLENKGTS